MRGRSAPYVLLAAALIHYGVLLFVFEPNAAAVPFSPARWVHFLVTAVIVGTSIGFVILIRSFEGSGRQNAPPS